MKNTYVTHSVEETIALGNVISRNIEKGCVIALSGDLGVGKTAITKGIARGLDIDKTISSPTFTLMKQYEGRLSLCHIDAYRLENVSSDSLGLYDMIDDTTVVVIEWGQFLKDLDLSIDIHINIVYIDENERLISIERT